jgi:hypothetical protein
VQGGLGVPEEVGDVEDVGGFFRGGGVVSTVVAGVGGEEGGRWGEMGERTYKG